ncbi:MAG: ComEC/Rec2 family competence protein [Kofleriaceae bacterium]
MVRLIAVMLAIAGCSPAVIAPSTPAGQEPRADAPRISWRRITTAADLPALPPSPGSYRIHMIDVGTGLSILVQGADFVLLYDAGTNDREERPLRVVSYLARAIGRSGDELCGSPADPPVARRRIDHVVLSHPHLDHASALDLVLHCYEVAEFWDPGRITETVFYRELLAAIARTPGLTYRTAATVPSEHTITVKSLNISIGSWRRFSEGDVVELGAGARFTILHADPKSHGDPNQSSLVLLVELGGARLLLTGDAESGDRRDPSYPVGDVERFLIDHHAPDVRADILQVGHHGSKTSSRRGFLEAVQPRIALISSGPKRYGKIVLPDPEVVDELARIGATVLRTDEHDTSCSVVGRMGGDIGPGGCDAWLISIEPLRRR